MGDGVLVRIDAVAVDQDDGPRLFLTAAHFVFPRAAPARPARISDSITGGAPTSKAQQSDAEENMMGLRLHSKCRLRPGSGLPGRKRHTRSSRKILRFTHPARAGAAAAGSGYRPAPGNTGGSSSTGCTSSPDDTGEPDGSGGGNKRACTSDGPDGNGVFVLSDSISAIDCTKSPNCRLVATERSIGGSSGGARSATTCCVAGVVITGVVSVAVATVSVFIEDVS